MFLCKLWLFLCVPFGRWLFPSPHNPPRDCSLLSHLWPVTPFSLSRGAVSWGAWGREHGVCIPALALVAGGLGGRHAHSFSFYLAGLSPSI